MPANSDEAALYPWQQDAWSDWLALRASDRIPHAILLHSNPGIGAAHLGQHMARSLLCDADSPDAKPCGQCRSCHLAKVGTHRDYWQVVAEKEVITMAQVQDAIEFLSLARHSRQHRVVLIPEAGHLSYNSSNALLKVLEEPPEWSVIVMTTEHFGRILPTIRSRCHKIHLPLPSETTAVAWLTEQLGCDASAAREKLHWHDGQVLNALDDNDDQRAMFRKDLVTYLNHQMDIAEFAERWYKEPVQRTQNWLMGELHETIKQFVSGRSHQLAGSLPVERLDGERFEGLYQAQIERCRASGSNPNARLILECSLLEFRRAFSA